MAAGRVGRPRIGPRLYVRLPDLDYIQLSQLSAAMNVHKSVIVRNAVSDRIRELMAEAELEVSST